MTLDPSSSAFISFLSYRWLFNVATSFVNGPYVICYIPVQEVLGLQATEDGAGGGGVAAAGWLAARPRHRGEVLH